MLNIITLFVLLAIHPFHVSVTDIVFKEDTETLEITHRFFIDDMEETLDKKYSVAVDILKESGSNRLDSVLNVFIKNHFKLFVDDEFIAYDYLGHETDGDAIWLYCEVKEYDDEGELTVFNNSLIDIFPKQTNLVHFTLNDHVTSIRLYKEHEVDKIKYRED